MKTSAKHSVQNRREDGVDFINQLSKVIFVFIISLFSFSGLFGQDVMSGRAFLDFGFDYSASNNGHSAFYAPTLIINKRFNGLAISPLVYQDNHKVNGIKLSYIRNLSGKASDDVKDNVITVQDSLDYIEYKKFKKEHRDILEVNFYSYVQYNRSLPLSASAVAFEQENNLEMNVNWNQVKVSTGEAGFGIQLQYNITNTFSFKVYSGLGAYYHFDYKQELHKGRNAFCLNSGATLLYTFDILHPVSKKHHTNKGVKL
ncbi:MAG: hypothetical protein WCR21_01410 [Bacteroidota bacterium]